MKTIELNLRIDVPDSMSNNLSKALLLGMAQGEIYEGDLEADFEEAQKMVDDSVMHIRSSYNYSHHMNFGQAIQALKEGQLVTRTGWNGKDMFLWMKSGIKLKAEECGSPILRGIATTQNGEIEMTPTICMKTADDKVVVGWLASQTDMLAEDWVAVNLNKDKEK